MNAIDEKRIIACAALAALQKGTPLSIRRLARNVHISRPTVTKVIDKVRQTPERFINAQHMPDSALLSALQDTKDAITLKAVPDYPRLSSLIKQYSLTKQAAYKIYCDEAQRPVVSLSTYYEGFAEFEHKQEPSMSFQYQPGEVTFVDFVGKKPCITDPLTGQKVRVEIFTGILGYSSYAFVYACASQSQEDFAHAHSAMFTFFGGATQFVVTDNLKAAVIKPGITPVLNSLYAEMGLHFGTTIMPARVYRPKDKARVENLVRLTYRYIFNKLKHQVFFSLDELNAAILVLLKEFNDKPFSKMDGSRASLFEDKERHALTPCPATELVVYIKRVKRKVSKQYLINYDNHLYSVPHQLIGKTVDIKATARQIYCFYDGELCAEHAISSQKGGVTIAPSHMPAKHREYIQLNHDQLLQWAKGIGPATTTLIEAQFNGTNDSTPDVKARCSAFKSLLAKHGRDAFETAAAQAAACSVNSLRFMQAMLNPTNNNQPLH